MHACRSKGRSYFFEQFLREADIGAIDNIGSFGGNASFEVKCNGSVIVTLFFLNLCSLFLLVGLNQPIVVVFLEFFDIGMMFLFSTLDGFVPFV